MNESEDPIDELSQLRKDVAPPPYLEGRVVSMLMKKGLLRRRSTNWMKAVAAILIFCLGLGCGKFVWKVTPRYTHILLLKEDPANFKAVGHEASLVREYSDWASNIRQRGTNITGEKLDPSRVILGVSESEREVIAGLFMLKADTDAAALNITKDCPHLKHGGTIELRRIDTFRN